jgi:hypothetical protein
MAYIQFTDSVGTATLDNGLRNVGGGVGSRFSSWTPRNMPIGARETSLGTGRQYMFKFRTDYMASFSIDHIPMASLGTVVRFIEHVYNGNTCSVYTEDSASNSYITCGLPPGAEINVQSEDRSEQWYRMDVTLINLAVSPVAMLCVYT